MILKKHYFVTAIVVGVFVVAAADWSRMPAVAESPASKQTPSGFSGDPNKPRRHFRARDVAELSADETRDMYRQIRNRLAAGYGISGDATAKAYQSWPLLNTTPYRSATHGQRFVNNFINGAASAYDKHEAAGILPTGAIIAKDSFVVATNGTVTPGPLFIMEKMEKGFNYVSGDWRYSMIMPDGSNFGVTNGANSERVEFCIGCHLAREKYDHLFFVPKAYRRN
ncbi:MAG: hypothetical protein GKS00_19655 [Alphaproteobacteria bacterium]|nr:hypothetical protein [Alphaproteobacteria bacterium]